MTTVASVRIDNLVLEQNVTDHELDFTQSDRFTIVLDFNDNASDENARIGEKRLPSAFARQAARATSAVPGQDA